MREKDREKQREKQRKRETERQRDRGRQGDREGTKKRENGRDREIENNMIHWVFSFFSHGSMVPTSSIGLSPAIELCRKINKISVKA